MPMPHIQNGVSSRNNSLQPSMSGGLMPTMPVAAASSEPASKRQKTAFQDNAGTSLVEAFSAEEIQVHLQSLQITSAPPSK